MSEEAPPYDAGQPIVRRVQLAVTPMAAPRQTQRDKWHPSPAVERYRAYCAELVIRARQAGWEPGERLRLVFHLPMPPSWSGRKKRAMLGQPHQQKPDTDNLLKGVCDCLLADDSHVWEMQAQKRWAVMGRIEVEG